MAAEPTAGDLFGEHGQHATPEEMGRILSKPAGTSSRRNAVSRLKPALAARHEHFLATGEAHEQQAPAPKAPTRAEQRAQVKQAAVDNPTRGTFVENAVPAPMVAAKYGHLAPTAPKLKGPEAVTDRLGGATVTGSRTAADHEATLNEGVHGTEEERVATLNRMASQMKPGERFDVRPWGEHKAREAASVHPGNIHDHLAGLSGSKNVWVGMPHPEKPGHSVGMVLRRQGGAGYRMAGPLREAQNISADSALPQPTYGQAITRKYDLGSAKRERAARSAEADAPTAAEYRETPGSSRAVEAAAKPAADFESHMAEQNRRARNQPDLQPVRATDEDEPDRQRGTARVDRADDSTVDKDLFGNPAHTVGGVQGDYPAEIHHPVGRRMGQIGPDRPGGPLDIKSEPFGGGRVGGDTRPTQGAQRFAPTEESTGRRAGLPAGSNWMHPDLTRAMSRGEIRDRDTARHNQEAQSAFELQRTRDTQDRVATESHPMLTEHDAADPHVGRQFAQITQQGAAREGERYAPVDVKPRSEFTDPAKDKFYRETPVPGETPGTVRRPGYAPEGIQPGDVPASRRETRRATEWENAAETLGGRAERAARMRGRANVAPGARQGKFVGEGLGTVGGGKDDPTAAPAPLDEATRSGYSHTTTQRDPETGEAVADPTQDAINDYHHFINKDFDKIRGGSDTPPPTELTPEAVQAHVARSPVAQAIQAEAAGVAEKGTAAKMVADRAGIEYNPNHTLEDMRRLHKERQAAHFAARGETGAPVTQSSAGSVNEGIRPEANRAGAARLHARSGKAMEERASKISSLTMSYKRREPGISHEDAVKMATEHVESDERWEANDPAKIKADAAAWSETHEGDLAPAEVKLTGEDAAAKQAKEDEEAGEGQTAEEKEEEAAEQARAEARAAADAREAEEERPLTAAEHVEPDVTGRETGDEETGRMSMSTTTGEGGYERDPYASVGTKGPEATPEQRAAAQARSRFNTTVAGGVWPHSNPPTPMEAARARGPVGRPAPEPTEHQQAVIAGQRNAGNPNFGGYVPKSTGPAPATEAQPKPQRYWSGEEPPAWSGSEHARDYVNPRQMAAMRATETAKQMSMTARKKNPNIVPNPPPGQAYGGEPEVTEPPPRPAQSGIAPTPNAITEAIASHASTPAPPKRRRTMVSERGARGRLGNPVPGTSVAATVTPEQAAVGTPTTPAAEDAAREERRVRLGGRQFAGR